MLVKCFEIVYFSSKKSQQNTIRTRLEIKPHNRSTPRNMSKLIPQDQIRVNNIIKV